MKSILSNPLHRKKHSRTQSLSVSPSQAGLAQQPNQQPAQNKSQAADQKDDSAKQVEDDPYLLNLIEAEQLEPSIRAIFESGKETEVINNLDAFIIKKEKDIEDICSWHYQEFIRAVDELLDVRLEAKDLEESVVHLNDDFQSQGKVFTDKYAMLIESRRVRKNVSLAIDAVKDCQYVLSLISQMNNHIALREFYSALKLLEQVETVYIPRVANYSFIQYFSSTISKLKETFRRESLEDFNTWLLNLRMNCVEIGKFAMEQTFAQLYEDEKHRVSTRILPPELQRELTGETSGTAKDNNNNKNDKKKKDGIYMSISSPTIVDESLYTNKRYKVDFTPLYQCLEVHRSMEVEKEFIDYYRENRRLQANVALRPTSGVNIVNEEAAYQQYFWNIAGFFIVEQTVHKSTNDLVSTSVLEKLWDMAVSKMKTVLQEQMAYTLDPAFLIDLKNFLLLFVKTLQSFNYDVTQLYEFFTVVRDVFQELEMNRIQKKFVELLEKDKWEPLNVSDRKEFETLILKNKLQVSDSEVLPQKFVFSKMIPMYCTEFRQYIIDCYRFAKYFDMDDYVKKCVEKLIRTLNQSWVSFVGQSKSLLQYVQSWVNLTQLLTASELWEYYITSFSVHGAKVKFNKESLFEEYRLQFVKLMDELIQAKIRDFIFIAKESSIQWTPAKQSEEIHQYMHDMVMYLDSSVSPILNSLPSTLQESLQIAALQTFSSAFMELLSSETTYKFNSFAVKTFDADLKYLESYVDRSKYKDTKDYLMLPRQLIDLLLSEHVDQDFIDASTRKKKYWKLENDLGKLIVILEKFKDDSRFAIKRSVKMAQVWNLLLHLKKETATQ